MPATGACLSVLLSYIGYIPVHSGIWGRGYAIKSTEKVIVCSTVYIYILHVCTLLIRVPLIRMPHNPNTLPVNRFYHFLFTVIHILLGTMQAVRINEV